MSFLRIADVIEIWGRPRTGLLGRNGLGPRAIVRHGRLLVYSQTPLRVPCRQTAGTQLLKKTCRLMVCQS